MPVSSSLCPAAQNLTLVAICLTVSGCVPSSRPVEEARETSSGDSEEQFVMMFANPRVGNDGQPESPDLTRLDFPSLEDVREAFEQLEWTDTRYSPHMGLGRPHPDGLNITRPPDQHDSGIIMALWIDDTGMWTATLESEEQAWQLVAAWYNEQDLTELADWKSETEDE
jgi:hypothetical protein